MGHLFAAGAQQSSDDDQERPILGNIECVSAAAFPTGLAYVALGHIHRAQVIGGHGHIRYCGTPVPMSFTESNYRHQVLSFEINNRTLENLAPIDVPVSIPLLRIPAAHQPFHEVISLINGSPDSDEDLVNAPYLEVRVLLEGPEPGLRYKIENALKGKYARLAKIDIKYLQAGIEAKTQELAGKKLEDIRPVEVFTRVYEAKYHSPVPEILAGLFNEVLIEASSEEEK
jgi:exonuclease SbcD